MACPVCGKQWYGKHACSVRALAAIDAAHTRALNAEDPETPSPPAPFWRTPDVRIGEGFALIAQAGDRD